MMHGTRLLAIGARLMRGETFERVLLPAVADLQHEEAALPLRLRSYFGVLRAIRGGLWWDVQYASTELVRSDRFRSAATAASIPIAYIAALTFFFSDLSAGAYELRRSAVLTNPLLRIPFLSAASVLGVLTVAWVSGQLASRISRRNARRNDSAPWRVLCCIPALLIISSNNAGAQVSDSKIVSVDGRAMRFQAAGLERRQPMQPVVILEAGAVDPGKSHLDEWTKVYPLIANVAPVIAYERRGNGMSEDDTEIPTMRRVAHVLHDMLHAINVPPPYVLVGHSWGGNYIRAFTDEYPTEVVGLVFIDAFTGADPTREEKAAVLPPDRRAEALKPPVLPPMPPNLRPGHRAEFEEVAKEMTNDGAEARTFKPVTGIPIGIIVATPPARLRGDGGPITKLMIQKDLEMVLLSPNGMLITADHVGHAVQNDDPALVSNVIKHILDHPANATKP